MKNQYSRLMLRTNLSYVDKTQLEKFQEPFCLHATYYGGCNIGSEIISLSPFCDKNAGSLYLYKRTRPEETIDILVLDKNFALRRDEFRDSIGSGI